MQALSVNIMCSWAKFSEINLDQFRKNIAQDCKELSTCVPSGKSPDILSVRMLTKLTKGISLSSKAIKVVSYNSFLPCLQVLRSRAFSDAVNSFQ